MALIIERQFELYGSTTNQETYAHYDDVRWWVVLYALMTFDATLEAESQ